MAFAQICSLFRNAMTSNTETAKLCDGANSPYMLMRDSPGQGTCDYIAMNALFMPLIKIYFCAGSPQPPGPSLSSTPVKAFAASDSQAAPRARPDQQPQRRAAAVGAEAAPLVCLKAKINLPALGATILPLGPGPLGNSAQSVSTGVG